MAKVHPVGYTSIPIRDRAGPISILKNGWFWVVAIGSLALLSQTLVFGFGYDHGILQYTAWASLKGLWPYTDTWETAFPGGILLHTLILWMGGTSALSFRVFDLLVQAAASMLLFVSASRIAGPRAGAIAAFLYLSAYITGGYYQTAQRDGFIVPLLLLTLWSLDNYSKSPRIRWTLVSGCGLGLTCFIRPTYALLAALVAAYVLFTPTKDHLKFIQRIYHVVLLGFLCALPMMLFIGMYIYRGALPELMHILSFLTVVYPSIERISTFRVLLSIVKYASKFMWVGVGLWAVSIVARRQLQQYTLLMIFLAGCVAIRIFEAKEYIYQYWPVLMCLAILAGVGWEVGATWLVQRLKLAPSLRGRIIGLAVGAIVLLPVISSRTMLHNFANLASELQRSRAEDPAYRSLVADSADQAEIARYLREHTAPTDSIQLWGPESGVYYAAGRLSANRFPKPTALVCGELKLFSACAANQTVPAQTAWKQEYLDGVAAKRPRYIVAHYAQGSLAQDQPFGFAPDFPELRAILDRDYTVETTIGIWSIFRRTDGR
jgi:hypothetical protein